MNQETIELENQIPEDLNQDIDDIEEGGSSDEDQFSTTQTQNSKFNYENLKTM